jgi:hypothetical protein
MVMQEVVGLLLLQEAEEAEVVEHLLVLLQFRVAQEVLRF